MLLLVAVSGTSLDGGKGTIAATELASFECDVERPMVGFSVANNFGRDVGVIVVFRIEVYGNCQTSGLRSGAAGVARGG